MQKTNMQKLEKKSLKKKDLQKTAGLEVKRKEHKYYINYSDFITMSSALEKILKRDSHDKGKGYFIRSLYFDSLGNKAFEEKMAGVETRKKIRIRIYDFVGKKSKLEIKNKIGDCIIKESLWIKKEDAEELALGNYEVLLDYDNKVARKIYVEFRKFLYKPVVIIDYERNAFVYDFNNVRITFDRNIRANSINLNMFDKLLFMKPLLSKKLVVLEIKFDRFMPDWLKSIVLMKNCNSAISKYCIGRLDNRIGYL